jgi:hypothetical protein
MPSLRPYNDPEFCFIGEVVDFVTQLLEVRITCCLYAVISLNLAGDEFHALPSSRSWVRPVFPAHFP